MQGQYYPDVFSREGITVITPGAEEQVYIHDKYMNELVNGIIIPETRERLLAIVDRLKAQEGIEGLILGGTELPLIFRQETYNGIPFLDTTKIHVECALSQMLT
jgi:aspartate racemase